jgi:hypothetical protein
MLLGPSIASGEVRQQPINTQSSAPMYGFVGEMRDDGMIMARQVLPSAHPGTTSIAAVAQSKVIYLNKNGVTLSPGDNDSRTNKSTIVTQTTAIPAWNVSATNWAATVSCMKDLFKPFNVTVTDVDPGNVPHMEAVFGGTPQQVGMDANTAGVSPFTLDCSIIENSVVFTFTGAFQLTSREACEIMAQEVAHSYGLDHELLASDPMTYLNYNGNRAFQNQTAQCGESTARQCGINGSVCRANQNSVTLLTERLGASDAIAPMLSWTSPSNNSTVPPGFEVHASGTDNIAVTGATLKIDGMQVDAKTGSGPFVFTTPTTLAEGAHTLIIEITDGKNPQTETRNVTVKKGAPPPSDTTGTGNGDDTGTGTGTDDTSGGADAEILGGCNAAGGQLGLLLALGLVGLARRRRR